MINQAEINKKAMHDIFAMDEAVGQFESFGSQLDLGLPSVEDDAPKSFEDMLDVNPSNEPTESGEYFMNEGDDLQDTATQKFVVDEFAKQLMKCDDTISVQDRLPDIAAYIQGTNNIKGDVQSFLRNTIDRATAFQQAQNVSDAQPNGVVDPNATPAAPVDGVTADPTAEGIPTMAPIEPTAEPTLEPNAGDVDPLAGLDGIGDDLGAAEATDDILGDEPVADEPAVADDLGVSEEDIGLGDEAPAEAEPAVEDEGDDLAGILGDDGEDKPAEEDEKPAEEATDDTAEKEPKEEDAKADDDADFDFESIAKKAHGLVEGAEEGAEESVADEGADMGEQQAETDLGAEEAPVTECGDKAPAEVAKEPIEECGDAAPVEESVDTELAEKKAQVEAIARQCRLRLTAEKAKKLVESYQQNRARSKTEARLESVVENLRKKVVTESIIDKFAKESKAAAETVTAEPEVKKPSAFESIMDKGQKALEEAKAVERTKAAADKVIAEFEASAKIKATLDAIVESAASKVNADKAKDEARSAVQSKLDNILESVAKKNEASKVEDQLAKIVDEVKNS